MNKHLFSLFHTLKTGVLVAGLTLTASAEQFGDFTYRVLTEGTVEITDYPEDAIGPVAIPATIEGMPVTSIGSGAFANCTGIKSVHIPDSVTSILGVSYVYEGGPAASLATSFANTSSPPESAPSKGAPD